MQNAMYPSNKFFFLYFYLHVAFCCYTVIKVFLFCQIIYYSRRIEEFLSKDNMLFYNYSLKIEQNENWILKTDSLFRVEAIVRYINNFIAIVNHMQLYDLFFSLANTQIIIHYIY